MAAGAWSIRLSLSQKTRSQLCRRSLSKHFVEVPLKMDYSDKVFRQRIPTKTLRRGLWDKLSIRVPKTSPCPASSSFRLHRSTCSSVLEWASSTWT
jgi:hypothetical protein